MFRMRRYRVYVAFVAITIFAFYHFSRIQNFRETSAAGVERLRKLSGSSVVGSGGTSPGNGGAPPASHPIHDPRPGSPPKQDVSVELGSPEKSPGEEKAQKAPPPAESEEPREKFYPSVKPIGSARPASLSKPILQESTSVPVVSSQKNDAISESVHSVSTRIPEKEIATSTPAAPATTSKPKPYHGYDYEDDTEESESLTLHWANAGEHFPVPTTSLFTLPTDAPQDIPRIQRDFSRDSETAAQRDLRETRLGIVRRAFEHSWQGYKKHAWMHDELVPVKGTFKDPFCGWAATLVDSLDTLWIMGLTEEFEEAIKAVNKIDFTTSMRNDIPVFETTIRYLGGLLAAFDISGAKYHGLLSKAVELADVLMGAFDTPNRMPMLYYRWKPAFTSQPHRANSRVVLAELGSLSLEFTRLAQLTGEQRFYDAVARITDALEIWQMHTALPGLWPITVDASGCNKSSKSESSEWSELFSSQMPILNNGTRSSKFKDFELEHDYESGGPRLAPPTAPRETKAGPATSGAAKAEKSTLYDEVGDPHEKRQLGAPVAAQPAAKETEISVSALTGKEVTGDSDCVPQGLASPYSSYSEEFGIGGRADSVYEYLPKEYILLGGNEEKYKTMYIRAVEVIKNKLLYRPLIKDSTRGILVAGLLKKGKDEEEEQKLTPEITHLTCFAGGMMAIAAKIFGRPEEITLGRRLTDGCVWAYESTITGMMPETATLVPCEDPAECAWNETKWHEALDPNRARREKDYKAQQELIALAEKGHDSEDEEEEEGGMAGLEDEEDEYDPPPVLGPERNPSPGRGSLDKRHGTHSLKTGIQDTKQGSAPINDSAHPEGLPTLPRVPPALMGGPHLSLDEKKAEVEAALGGGGGAPTVPKPASPARVYNSLTHEEYVASRIENEHLPEGYARITDSEYKLRPEAIESVWIMFRITGDEYWRDKGWEMFRAIESRTKTEFGHSAIADVSYNGNASALLATPTTGSAKNQTSSAARRVWRDSMESFWLAETLKYFYLLYSEPGVVSLDEWVLNTEAHPFRRPDAGPLEV